MARKYPEKVSANMFRIVDVNEVLILRRSTVIQLGTSQERLGMVVMTNPGKFEFKKSLGWEQFKNGEGVSTTFESADYPDLSMQNVINVLRLSFERAGLGKPEGTVSVVNISNIRQPHGVLAETYHTRALHILRKNNGDVALLEDPVTNRQEDFLRECQKSKLVIMGFVDGVFRDQVQRIIHWSEDVKSMRVCAVDDKGRYSHPRRWRTEPHLMNRAIESMTTVLKG